MNGTEPSGSRLTPIRHVILDRDGVLNRELVSGWLTDLGQWQWEEGAIEALGIWATHGTWISVVTNQSGIGRGVASRQAVDGIHEWLGNELSARGIELVGIFVCPHAPDEGCDCRKPRPGLILEAVEKSGIPTEETIVIGDDLRDLAAGRAAGLRVGLVCTGKGPRVRDSLDEDALVFRDLIEAATRTVART
ncbi:MAG: HAD-IIIA family hydrolase [Nitrospirae bacterium]|nr:HAD-IIIA family hydrolase [Nitrospirota bacterium]